MTRIGWVAAYGLGAALLAGCTSVPTTHQPHEYLDERTGASITTADKPMIFARDRTERAANLRDYLTLVAASINRAGAVEYVWIAYAWSTLDPMVAGEHDTATLVITADDRRIKLQPLAASAIEAGVSQPLRAPPGVNSISHVYGSDLATMTFLTTARGLRLQVGDSDVAPYYELWDDGRGSLGEFVRFANGQ